MGFDKKAYMKEYNKKYYNKNKDILNSVQRREKNQDRLNENNRRYRAANKNKVQKQRIKYRENNKLKTKASATIRRLVYTGKILKPSCCSFCKKECNPDAHHADYLKILEIIWLCRKCHKAFHGFFGEGKNG